MNSLSELSFSSHADAFRGALSLEAVRQRAPAIFAASADDRRSHRYTFIPTQRVLTGLMQAGFEPVDVRQTHTRSASPLHARHIVRLRRTYETIQLRDAIPEIIFLNSHDGTSAYQLRMGLFRVICTNGLIVSRGAFAAVCVSHRGDIVEQVVTGAVGIAERFVELAGQIEAMERRRMFKDEQLQFAGHALALRYGDPWQAGMSEAQLLSCRREQDAGDDLWSTLNRVQENLLAGGLSRRSASGRLVRTRRITSIREDVRINGALWDLAREVLAA